MKYICYTFKKGIICRSLEEKIMNCKFCGKELAENAAFCPECGKSVTEEVAAPVENVVENDVAAPIAEVKKLKKKISFNTVCLLVGTLLIIIGFIRLMDSSVSISSTSFGADFYTYAYKGIVACAEMLGKINKTLSWCLISIGAIIDIKAIRENRKSK